MKFMVTRQLPEGEMGVRPACVALQLDRGLRTFLCLPPGRRRLHEPAKRIRNIALLGMTAAKLVSITLVTSRDQAAL
jgi:hypothetical protein